MPQSTTPIIVWASDSLTKWHLYDLRKLANVHDVHTECGRRVNPNDSSFETQLVDDVPDEKRCRECEGKWNEQFAEQFGRRLG